MSGFEIVINCVIALGSFATVGTFIKMITVRKIQKERITRLEEQQIDAEYKPNLRVENNGSTNYGCSVTLKNYGKSIVIREIVSHLFEWLKWDSIETWFPLQIDAGDTIVIPLVGKAEMFQEGSIYLTVTDKLDRSFKITISSVNKKFMVSKVEQI